MAALRDSTPAPAPSGCAARLGGALICAVFLAAGLFFTWGLGREVYRAAETRAWPRVPCAIVQSSVHVVGAAREPYRPSIRYRYTFGSGGGQSGDGERLSEQWRRKEVGFTDYRDAQLVVDRYAPGAATTCFLNPANPSEAVLEHGPLWHALFLLIPLLFVLLGGGGVWFSLRPTAAAPPAGGDPGTPSARGGAAISEQSNAGRNGLVLLFGIFLIAGLTTTWPLLLRPATRLARAQSWPAVPCRIVSSEVGNVSTGEGDSYRPFVLYRYTLAGREYRSNRITFAPATGGKSAGARAVARQYRPGSAATCYVDPGDPTMAVLDRGFTPAMLFGLIPLGFALMGTIGLGRILRRKAELPGTGGRGGSLSPITPARLAGPRGTGRAARSAPATAAGNGAASPAVLAPRSPAWAKFLGVLLFAAFWNGVLSIFLVEAISDYRRGRGNLCLTAFLVPFVVIGLITIGAAIHQFLAMFNPRPQITAGGTLRPGATVDLKWLFTGRYDRILRLRITLEGREEATYRRGTDTTTDKRVFHKAELIDTGRGMDIRAGTAKLSIPDGTMHSFAAPNNKIIWELAIHGEISGWPDVKQEFNLDVLPLEVGR